MVRWFVLLLAVYIAADVVNPQMPGVVVFDPEECVEARQSGSFWAIDDARAVDPLPPHSLGVVLVKRPTPMTLFVHRHFSSPIHHMRGFLPPRRALGDDSPPPAPAALT